VSTESLTTVPEETRIPGPVILFMALAAAWGTAAIYPMQPAITEVAAALGSRVGAAGLALACGPVGYLVGLALLVPLVDRHPPRRVLATQFGVLAVALAAGAAAPNVAAFGLVMTVIGACSAVGAGLSSVAGRLAGPGGRATVLGIVTAGISAGILAGRIVGGWLTDQIGWRGTLLAFAAVTALVALGCLAILPAARGTSDRGYLAILRSLPGLFLRYGTLRLAAFRGALWFCAFCAVWAGLAVTLSEPPFSYPADRIGLYALAGLSGILATRIAGVWTDRAGARRVILLGLLLAGPSAAVLGFGLASTAGTLVCLALFDAGLFAAQVANQSTVLAIDPSAPARFNSAYMVVYFVGGSIGTAFGASAVGWFGWPVTALLTAAAIGVAGAVTLLARPRPAGAEAR
jgi:predicted MFS family arabinose efflux permease